MQDPLEEDRTTGNNPVLKSRDDLPHEQTAPKTEGKLQAVSRDRFPSIMVVRVIADQSPDEIVINFGQYSFVGFKDPPYFRSDILPGECGIETLESFL